MSRKPDFRLKIMDRETGQKSSNIGAGWKNDNGSISIVIDFGCHIPWDNPSLLITLWPENGKPKRASSPSPDVDDADIPF